MDDPTTLAARAARAGGTVAVERFRTDVRFEAKAHKNDLVSEADADAQDRVVALLAAESDAPVVGEESDTPSTVPTGGPAWIVDPIDGTANYLRGLRLWATSVTRVEDGEPVAAATVMPAMDDEFLAGEETRLNGESVSVSDRADPETFAVAVLGWGPHGEREAYATLADAVVRECGDMRRLGSMQSALAFVASGGLDAAITTRRPNPWDSVGGAHMVRAAGGTVTDLSGERWRHDSQGLVASNGQAHGRLVELARDVVASVDE
ncbi:inositol monophosphatase family protein [Halorientalis regularis]|jgi:myo-inositol-1(or 4)-monophosphatase|uniref:fructose-bisphosphatase n=1 Tax=Halorientalis regularis TaxID=660518 RepID=A0A1G7NLC3_9EURY|nr:inositol monophosphatase [Halorientalis regularis]SDF74717.1 myo-inositol-1(or 4)-monophosphatase [Halorientalis regularis]